MAFWQQSIFQAARCNITFVQLLPCPKIVSLAIVNGSQYYQIHCTTLAIQLFYYSGWNYKLQVAALIYDSSVAFEKLAEKSAFSASQQPRIFQKCTKLHPFQNLSKKIEKNSKKGLHFPDSFAIIIKHSEVERRQLNKGAFPSGQWGQTVNLLLNASVVRIHQLPPQKPRRINVLRVFFVFGPRFGPHSQWLSVSKHIHG